MDSKRHPVIGLALGSGGANGLAHIGVIKVLEKHQIPIDCVAGSSIGALIGALYAVHHKSSTLEALAIQMSKKPQYELVDPTLKGGILKGEKITHIIEEFLHNSTFDDTAIPFASVATDFNTGETVVLRSGNLAQAVRASIAVPGILQPVIIGEHVLADGGLSEPIPVEAARAMSADIVIAVNLDELPPTDSVASLPSLPSIPGRSINILRHHLARASSITADFVITPQLAHKTFIGWNTFFNENKLHELVKAGADATAKTIPQLSQSLKSSRLRYNRFFHAIPFLDKLR